MSENVVQALHPQAKLFQTNERSREVKIIKKGKLTEDKLKKMKCGECKTVFQFRISEAERVMDGRDGDYYTINCPVCKQDINFV